MIVQLGEAHQFLRAAVLDDALHLFMYEFHTAKAWFLKATDLSLDKKLEGDFRYEECGAWTLRIKSNTELGIFI